MIPDQFLYCRICNEVHHVTPFDSAPIYDLEGMAVREIFIDDRRQFIDRHFDHEVEKLRSVTANHFPIGRLIDPMKVGYVEVTNGKEFFILRISRNQHRRSCELPNDLQTDDALGSNQGRSRR